MTTTGIPAGSTGETVHVDLAVGCYCKNDENGGACKYDYQVRFQCCKDSPSGQNPVWTPWFDRDNTGGNGDYEGLSDLIKEGNDICPAPIKI